MKVSLGELQAEVKTKRDSVALIRNKTLFAIIIVFFITFGISTTYALNNYLKSVTISNLTQSYAEQTSKFVFEIMYTKMQSNWTKNEINHTVARMNLLDSGLKVTPYRSQLVSQMYGDTEANKFAITKDELLQKALKGEPQLTLNHVNGSFRYLYPIKTTQECIKCHSNANIGDINGVIDINFTANVIQESLEGVLHYFLIFTLLAMLTTFFVFQQIIRKVFIDPISKFSSAIDSIIINDKFNESIHCKSKTHELKVLEISFNHLMEKINIMLVEIKTRNKILEEYKRAIDCSAIVTKTNTKGIITYANQKFVDISGYKPEELLGQSHNIVRSPTMPKESFQELWNTILNKQTWTGIIENRKKNGESYFVSATIMPVLDDDNQISEFIAIRQDITELKKLQLAELSSSIKTAITINGAEIVKMFIFPAVCVDINDKILAVNDSFKVTFHQYAFNTLRLTDLFIPKSNYISKDEILDWKDIVQELQTESMQKALINVDSKEMEFFVSVNRHSNDSNFLVFLLPINLESVNR